MSDAAQEKVDKAITAYQEKFARLPKDSDTLIAFSQTKESGCSKLSKKKHADLATAAIEKAKKKSKKGKGKGKKGKSAAAEEEAPAAPSKKKPKQAYKNGVTVLLSSDRVGVVRWFGELPSRGGYFYGVEFLGAFAGNCDGAVDGVRYFQTEPDRAKFFPPSKIRKVAKEKDLVKCLGHERAQSFLDKQSTLAAAASTATGEPTLEVVSETDEKEDDGGDEDAGGDDAADEETTEEASSEEDEAPAKKPRSGTTVERRTVVEPSELTILPADKRDTPLEFIIKQDDDTKAVLYDIFANPQLHAPFKCALENAAALSDDEQNEIWPELVARFVTYL